MTDDDRCANCGAKTHHYDQECRNCGYNGRCRACGEPTHYSADLLFCSRECEKEAQRGWEL